MNTVGEPLDRFRELARNPAAPPTGIHWLDQRRDEAAARLDRLSWPSRKDEGWRYTSLEPLRDPQFAPAAQPLSALLPEDIESLLLANGRVPDLVFANGRFAPALSNPRALPDGVWMGSLARALREKPEALKDHLARAGDPVDSLFAALNTALIEDGAALLVAEGTVIEAPIEVLYLSLEVEQPVIAQPRNLIVLQAGAQATLIERYASFGPSLYFNNLVTEVVLGQGAVLVHERLQEESRNAFHLAGLSARLDAHSRYHCVTAALGSAWSRTSLQLRFAGEGAESRLDGLYFAGDGKLVDHHLDVEHAVPGCSSEETFRGILDGRGVAVFDGRVLVAQDAQQTSAHLHNANLMLSRNAEVDTKPQLEIYADDVQCSHGTTVGQLEPEAMFYLRSRGISEPEARKMLCVGFAQEILERFSHAPLRERAERIIRQRLSRPSG